jgi:hypothetical protein
MKKCVERNTSDNLILEVANDFGGKKEDAEMEGGDEAAEDGEAEDDVDGDGGGLDDEGGDDDEDDDDDDDDDVIVGVDDEGSDFGLDDLGDDGGSKAKAPRPPAAKSPRFSERECVCVTARLPFLISVCFFHRQLSYLYESCFAFPPSILVFIRDLPCFLIIISRIYTRVAVLFKKNEGVCFID